MDKNGKDITSTRKSRICPKTTGRGTTIPGQKNMKRKAFQRPEADGVLLRKICRQAKTGLRYYNMPQVYMRTCLRPSAAVTLRTPEAVKIALGSISLPDFVQKMPYLRIQWQRR